MFKKYLPLLIALTLLGIASISVFTMLKTKAQTGDLVADYLFPVGDTGDAIGIKVIDNPKRLSPLSWYKKNVPNPGSPTDLTVNGYWAVREGRTVYVSATDVVNPDTNPEVYARIYLISYNDGASDETIEIYNQLLENWRFNINIDQKSKAQLQHDMNRFQDFNEIASALEDYYYKDAVCEGGTNAGTKCSRDIDCPGGACRGIYPTLGAGTYIRGESISQTNSRWPSWQNTLGKLLNQSLPVDSIN
ncbi:hypothetical protein MYX07_05510, partial [Patescibacteria group bacterium AH-259-L07]|nr:hypothetical protein [Patescibacteria group bacterium AH-259-L07]